MPTKKMRVEIFDGEGNKYTLTFEGQITRDKAVRLLDLVELLGGMTTSGHHESNPITLTNQLSKYDKIRMTIQKNFPLAWFSSREVQLTYEQEFKEPISLSTVATYLSRMASKGILVKTGASNRLKYRLAPTYPEASLKQVP
ncbi:MAG: hypothetical protein QXI91_01190 [Candidatus Bathyarchaeia archaeon]